jgi:hypothetical protein
MTMAQGGPYGEVIEVEDIVPTQVVNEWDPLRIGADGDIEVNYVDQDAPREVDWDIPVPASWSVLPLSKDFITLEPPYFLLFLPISVCVSSSS